jgi:phytoene/squalene synthetase
MLARGVRDLRRAVDPAALRRAGSPDELAESALIPAARNLAVAINLLPEIQRAESTAAVLACRVLDAYEDLYSGPAGGAATVHG